MPNKDTRHATYHDPGKYQGHGMKLEFRYLKIKIPKFNSATLCGIKYFKLRNDSITVEAKFCFVFIFNQ